MQKILFANIGWMIHYKGQSSSDRIIGGGSYDDDDKHEVYNFLEIDGKCYGYAQSDEIKLSRIDKRYVGGGKIDDVLVVWTAVNNKMGGRCIVGWYQHATVYAERIECNDIRRNEYSYNILADVNDCTLILPPENRGFSIPKGKGFFGRSLMWYADGATCDNESDKQQVLAFRKKVIQYVNDFPKTKYKYHHVKSVDAEARAKVEKAAVDFVTKRYKDLGFTIKDVQKDNVGWDLEATKHKLTLKIEVKGLAGDVVDVLLSKNEFQKMNDKDHQDEYRLCVVVNAITNPELVTFLHYGKDWVSEYDPNLILEFNVRTIEATIKQ